MDLFHHPGFMSYGHGSIEVLHADWPAYPSGHGWQLALRSLAGFPSTVRFRQIDDIDQCILFVAVGRGSCLEPRDDLYDAKLFHVAIWREDLLSLHERRLISGCSLLTEHEAALAYYHRMKDVLFETAEGLRRNELPYPEAHDFDDESPMILHLAEEGLGLTPKAEQALGSLALPVEALNPAIRKRAVPLLSIPLLDTAVREASVILESCLRDATASMLFGQDLVEQYYKLLCTRNEGRATAATKMLRAELRTLFKFVRNDFAHALREITPDQCHVLLDRVSDVLTTIHEIETKARGQTE